MPNSQAETSVPAAKAGFRRDDDFVSRYANNIQLESSAFDTKLIFGVIDQRNPETSEGVKGPTIQQHTEMCLAWPEAKLLVYFLQLHVASHEGYNGKIQIPEVALPPALPENPPVGYDNPKGREIWKLLRAMREKFIADLPK